MTEEPTLKQYNFLNSKGKYVEGMTKQQAHEAIAKIIPARAEVPGNPETYSGPVDAPVERPVDKPKREFHLSEEQVRTNAFELALNFESKFTELVPNYETLLERAAKIEEYLWNGN